MKSKVDVWVTERDGKTERSRIFYPSLSYKEAKPKIGELLKKAEVMSVILKKTGCYEPQKIYKK